MQWRRARSSNRIFVIDLLFRSTRYVSYLPPSPSTQISYDDHFLCFGIAGNYRLRLESLTQKNWLFSDLITSILATLFSLLRWTSILIQRPVTYCSGMHIPISNQHIPRRNDEAALGSEYKPHESICHFVAGLENLAH